MKQSKELNKAIKRAIKAAHAEREEMEKQRDIWERAIQEKDRQIDTLNGMLTPRKLAASIEVEEEKEKPFNDVWEEFKKTLDQEVVKNISILQTGREWCNRFYNYKAITLKDIIQADYNQVEREVFAPFLNFITCCSVLIDGVEVKIKIADNNGYVVLTNDETYLMDAWHLERTIQRIKPTN